MTAAKVCTASPEVIAYAEANRIDLTKVAATGPNGTVTLDDVKAAVQEPCVTPLVASLAARHGVDLRTVEPTGVAGRIRRDDVLRAAGVLPPAPSPAEEQAQATNAQCDAVGLRQWRSASAVPRSPAHALNPLADRARTVLAQANIPQPTEPAPQLFGTSDLPPFTASGIPVDMLTDVPWEARQALAAAPTQSEAYQIYTRCTQGDDTVKFTPEMCASDYADHPGNYQYLNRVAAWQQKAAEAAIDEDAWFAQFEPKPGLGAQ